ncbi:MAG: hypothetical protein R3E39_14150 [Anaerolineae bacterium]
MIESPLPTNKELLEFSASIPWQEIEAQKRKFNQSLKDIAAFDYNQSLPLDQLSETLGTPVSTYYDPVDTNGANIVLAEVNGIKHVLGSAVSSRYRGKKTFPQSIVPYNFNPSVNHTNLHETDDPSTRVRYLGAEIELGLVHRDGHYPVEDDMQNYMQVYRGHAQKLGFTPQIDREAGQYQVETHLSPVLGYQKTRTALGGILKVLTMTSEETGMLTSILAAYPVESDFKLTEDPKVQTAVDLMQEVNNYFPEYQERLHNAHARYHVVPPTENYVQMFRNQGCHIHLDLAGRCEALGLLAFYTMLRSATAVANAAVLKGSPFVNGTLDPELLCTREYLRRVTVTGRYLDLPTSPHLTANGLEHYSTLLRSERVNSPARAMLYEDGMGQMISVMHNPIGRIRPDLSTSKRICTLESTGMPASVSASRMAAVLIDFEYSHVLIEDYFRKYGCDLEPMYENRDMWSILGPLDTTTYTAIQDDSDKVCTDVVITTATGDHMTLAEFYEKKRIFMHRALFDIDVNIPPRDIDDVYVSMARMLEPPHGHSAQTIKQFIADPKLKSTGNWGKILKNAFLELGGSPGEHRPDLVLNIVHQMHDALRVRYLEQ